MFKDYFLKNEELINKELKSSKFKLTAKILFSFYKKNESINNAIKSIDYNIEFYPCLILIRCQIEHFLVATYIWIKFRITNKDDIAGIYCEDYLIYEILKRINYAKSNDIPFSSRIANIFSNIFEILTDKKLIKQIEIDKLNTEAKQFDIKKISKFFDNNLPLEYDNIIKPETIKIALEYYNYFSSFVHGGPTADAMFTEEYKKTLISEGQEIIEKSTNMVGFHRLYILYFLSINNEKIKKDFRKEMDKYLNENKSL